jgi:predicted nucleotidyltransferase/pimeloyl-ACP methyl ester carboxylesterase
MHDALAQQHREIPAGAPMKSITVSGQHLEYEFIGEGLLVVLVNNPTVSTQNQRVMADQLVKAGRQVLIFENHGPDSASIPEFVDALAGLLDSLNLRSVCLWGWSMGAQIIQELALVRPDLAGPIVLLGTAGRQTAFLRMFGEACRDALAPGVAGGANMRTVMFALGLWTPSMLANDTAVAALTADSSPPELALRTTNAGLAYDARLDALAAIATPTLVFGFELDMLTPPVLGREVADAIKGPLRGDRWSHARRSLHAHKPDHGRSAAVHQRAASRGSRVSALIAVGYSADMIASNPRITVDADRMEAFCRKWKIARLELFGSILRDDFGAESDIDLLVTFTSDARWKFTDDLDMEEELERLLRRKVDLVDRRVVESNPNWVRRRNILSTAQPFYEAA